MKKKNLSIIFLSILFLLSLSSSLFANDLHVEIFVGNGYSNSRDNVIAQGVTESKRQLVEMYKALDDMGIYDDVRFHILEGRSMTPSNAIASIEDINIRSGRDDVVFIFLGHGGSNQYGERFYCFCNGKNVWKKNIDDALEKHNPRLLIRYNESCSNIHSMRLSHLDYDDRNAVTSSGFHRLTANYDNLRRLFKQYKGVFDFSSSSVGKFSWVLNTGGVTSSALVDVLTGDKEIYDWGQLVEEVRDSVRMKFNLYIAQGLVTEDEIGGEDGIQIPEINENNISIDDDAENKETDLGNTGVTNITEDDFVDDWED